ncbi:MAG TPA: hypothetical protein VIL99_18580 [Ignavibacteria bacterium]
MSKNKKDTINKSDKFINSINIDEKYSKFYWVAIPLFTIIYFIYSYYSTGFYQDDEVGHFVTMVNFWNDPASIFDNWNKPGWKILMAFPALLGYNFVIFINCLFAGLTIYLSIILANKLGLKNTFLIVFFLGAQYTFVLISFRCYAEIFLSMIMLLICLLFINKKYKTVMLLSGYIFLLRQETILIIIVLIIYFFYKKQYIPILFIAIFPILLQIAGTIAHNNFMWMVKDIGMQSSIDFNKGTERDFFFYFKMYIFIVGPVTFAFLILGFFSLLRKKEQLKSIFFKYDIVYIVFGIYFLTQCLLVWHGTNGGAQRYLVPLAPFASIFALIGFNNFFKKEYKLFNLSLLIILSLFTLAITSKDYDNWMMTGRTEYLKFFIILIITISFFVLNFLRNKQTQGFYFIIIILLSIVYLNQKLEPLKLSPNNLANKSAAVWITNSEYKDRKFFNNHSTFLFYYIINGGRVANRTTLKLITLKDAPLGSIFIWDSQYSNRTDFFNTDTKLEYLKNNSNFKLLKDFTASDNRFYTAIFEKIENNDKQDELPK